jgi:predicted nucleic acid-binding protein
VPEFPSICVVDANVAVKLFIVQPESDKAEALFRRLESDPRARFHVPDFFYAECASAFALYVRQTRYAARQARDHLQALLALGLRPADTAGLATPALDLALAHGISGYDAFYVALSERLKTPLVTADAGLFRALKGKPFDVRLLREFA